MSVVEEDSSLFIRKSTKIAKSPLTKIHIADRITYCRLDSCGVGEFVVSNSGMLPKASLFYNNQDSSTYLVTANLTCKKVLHALPIPIKKLVRGANVKNENISVSLVVQDHVKGMEFHPEHNFKPAYINEALRGVEQLASSEMHLFVPEASTINCSLGKRHTLTLKDLDAELQKVQQSIEVHAAGSKKSEGSEKVKNSEIKEKKDQADLLKLYCNKKRDSKELESRRTFATLQGLEAGASSWFYTVACITMEKTREMQVDIVLHVLVPHDTKPISHLNKICNITKDPKVKSLIDFIEEMLKLKDSSIDQWLHPIRALVQPLGLNQRSLDDTLSMGFEMGIGARLKGFIFRERAQTVIEKPVAVAAAGSAAVTPSAAKAAEPAEIRGRAASVGTASMSPSKPALPSHKPPAPPVQKVGDQGSPTIAVASAAHKPLALAPKKLEKVENPEKMKGPEKSEITKVNEVAGASSQVGAKELLFSQSPVKSKVEDKDKKKDKDNEKEPPAPSKKVLATAPAKSTNVPNPLAMARKEGAGSDLSDIAAEKARMHGAPKRLPPPKPPV